MYLIDWEYSGMSDPAWDIGTFIACADYTMDEADGIIRRYMGREPSREELRHHLGYVAVASFYWFLWALYQDCVGKSVGMLSLHLVPLHQVLFGPRAGAV